MKDLSVTILAVFLFFSLVILVGIGRFHLFTTTIDSEKFTPDLQYGPPSSKTLFVFVHGGDGGKNSIPQIKLALRGEGDVLVMKFPAHALSNVDPVMIGNKIASEIEKYFRTEPHERIVLVGESLGALLARRAFIGAEEQDLEWAKAVSRIVLLAGMNRGWDISGKRPLDMPFERLVYYQLGTWLARLTCTGQLIISTEMGSPFVANLRIDWMKRFRDKQQRQVEVVQLLGDIDDIVSDEDNKDLRSMSSTQFAWIRVRGTGHLNITDFQDNKVYGNMTLGSYRQEKFLLAATKQFDEVILQNEEQSFQTDDKVTEVVFMVHGIRDLGEWAAAFEKELLRFKQPASSQEKVAIASIRYGYFGMGPFLLGPSRDKYVKWFMDEYTETLARYPNVKRIHFVGHSNGTYLLAKALSRYSSLTIDRVVFGGSVVPRDYNWEERLAGNQVKMVRNYFASDDWVVALFPRFFETWGVRNLLGNDIGSAGFNGFDQLNSPTSGGENVKIEGQHSAFLARTSEIAEFLLSDKIIPAKAGTKSSSWCLRILQVMSDVGTPILWFFFATLIVYVGWHVVTSGSGAKWPLLMMYLGLVSFILSRA